MFCCLFNSHVSNFTGILILGCTSFRRRVGILTWKGGKQQGLSQMPNILLFL